MADTPHTEYVIRGITSRGLAFRPGDWSERLAGVMSNFGPCAVGIDARLRYSYYVRPATVEAMKCVILDSRLRDIEPLAFASVLRFASDNDLVVTRRSPSTQIQE
jgi:hypothetical protein